MINSNVQLAEQTKIVTGLTPTSAPSGVSPRMISMKQYSRVSIIITVGNGTTVGGSAITLNQATTVTNTSGKALAFTTAKRNLDCAAGDALADFTVASNTFTTDTTNSKQLMYVIDVNEDQLDLANNFDCLNVAVGNATNTVVSVVYVLYPAEYGKATPPTAVTN